MKLLRATSVRLPSTAALTGPLLLVLVCAGMAACSQQTVGSGIPPVTAQITAAPAPLPFSVAPAASSASLEVLDTSLNLSVFGTELRIRPGSKLRTVWLRVRLPNGNISPLTLSPDCQCIRLAGSAAQSIGVKMVPGLSIETALAQGGPWTVAALTH
ncbi:hypothetical protein MF271_13860 [Deinococcus sp. KNUC1210]|uniref:hypothetical protein n=1 Tax=Deinococcus sp. KNUC1210 TaxID=2917691 RepID=UPI001EF0FFC5|nr:hypothetical protein [Deinococcus sp. KNUC1210]ULH15033.1 hypothetical protein MF271_13860 [Deinococcus sp. KNUC1210]